MRLWFFSEATESHKDEATIATRSVVMMGRQDLACIHGSVDEDLLEGLLRCLGIDPDRIYRTGTTQPSAFRSIAAQEGPGFARFLARHLGDPTEPIELVLYDEQSQPTASIIRWFRTAFGDRIQYRVESPEWMDRFGTKAMLHRRYGSEAPSVWERDVGRIDGVVCPKGAVCRTKEELMRAYCDLGLRRAVIKPVHGLGSLGIAFCESLTEVSRLELSPTEQYIIEQNFFELSARVDFFSVQYCGDQVVGRPVLQLFLPNGEWGGIRTCAASDAQDRIHRATVELVARIRPTIAGGFDMAYLHDTDQIIILDVNTDRFNGGHVPKRMAQCLGWDEYQYSCLEHRDRRFLETQARLPPDAVALTWSRPTPEWSGRCFYLVPRSEVDVRGRSIGAAPEPASKDARR